MKEVKELLGFIKRGENKKAAEYLGNLGETFCDEYTKALRQVVIVKTVEELNKTEKSFYIPAEDMVKHLFTENVSLQAEIDLITEKMRTSAKEDLERSYLKAKDYMEKNYSDGQFSLKTAADYAGISQSNLTKIFLEKKGETPLTYVSWLRVQKGETLLKNGKSVVETARETGFTGAETFIRAFKKVHGITPGVWKRNKLFL